MSASSSPTFRPVGASATARLTATVDLPTPPLPEATATIARTSGQQRSAWAGRMAVRVAMRLRRGRRRRRLLRVRGQHHGRVLHARLSRQRASPPPPHRLHLRRAGAVGQQADMHQPAAQLDRLDQSGGRRCPARSPGRRCRAAPHAAPPGWTAWLIACKPPAWSICRPCRGSDMAPRHLPMATPIWLPSRGSATARHAVRNGASAADRQEQPNSMPWNNGGPGLDPAVRGAAPGGRRATGQAAGNGPRPGGGRPGGPRGRGGPGAAAVAAAAAAPAARFRRPDAAASGVRARPAAAAVRRRRTAPARQAVAAAAAWAACWCCWRVVVLWLASGFYRVQPDEQGVVLRFGAYNARTPPGLNYHCPGRSRAC